MFSSVLLASWSEIGCKCYELISSQIDDNSARLAMAYNVYRGLMINLCSYTGLWYNFQTVPLKKVQLKNISVIQIRLPFENEIC